MVDLGPPTRAVHDEDPCAYARCHCPFSILDKVCTVCDGVFSRWLRCPCLVEARVDHRSTTLVKTNLTLFNNKSTWLDTVPPPNSLVISWLCLHTVCVC